MARISGNLHVKHVTQPSPLREGNARSIFDIPKSTVPEPKNERPVRLLSVACRISANRCHTIGALQKTRMSEAESLPLKHVRDMHSRSASQVPAQCTAMHNSVVVICTRQCTTNRAGRVGRVGRAGVSSTWIKKLHHAKDRIHDGKQRRERHLECQDHQQVDAERDESLYDPRLDQHFQNFLSRQ